MKLKTTKNFSKKQKLSKTRDGSLVEHTYITLFFGCVLMIVILSLFFASFVNGAEGVDLSIGSDTPKSEAKTGKNDKVMDDLANNKALVRIIDMNGVVGIDGSLRVLEANYTKIFDLVSISTPVAPASGHCRIWLNSSDGDLRVLFDNGVSKTLAAN